MKLLRNICLSILALLVLSSAGGYFYFKQQFKAPLNQLVLPKGEYSIPIRWLADSTGSQPRPYAALLLPVTLPGCSRTFYMQFDLGAPYSLFYKGKLETIAQNFPEVQFKEREDSAYLLDFPFRLGGMGMKASEIKVINYGGTAVDWNDTTGIEIIGTIGADLIERKVLVLDYPQGVVVLIDEVPATLAAQAKFSNLTFDERRVVLGATINKQETKLLFDSGTSAFELLTDKATWSSLAKKNAPVRQYGVNSWGNTLQVHSVASEQEIAFGDTVVPLNHVHYIEGTTFVQQTLMRFTGMGGMVGNQLFLDKVIVLDTRNHRFGMVQ
jgi:hypothetical protein